MSDLPRISLAVSMPLSSRARVAALLELAKLRIVSLVLVATAVGFGLSAADGIFAGAGLPLFHVLFGTALSAAGGNALNQFLEMDFDRLMKRTANRPLPAGRLHPLEAMGFGVSLVVLGAGYLAILVNPLTAILTAAAAVSYVLVYTPMKRLSGICVLVGAVPGALPPVIGWTAGAGELSIGAAMLFAILYFWQLPHFAAIAFQYREDYAAAGYPMLSVVDEQGVRLSLHVVTHTAAMIVASLLPAFYGLVGSVYAMGAMVMGLSFLAFCIYFLSHRTTRRARAVVLASVLYLPLLLGLMLADRV